MREGGSEERKEGKEEVSEGIADNEMARGKMREREKWEGREWEGGAGVEGEIERRGGVGIR